MYVSNTAAPTSNVPPIASKEMVCGELPTHHRMPTTRVQCTLSLIANKYHFHSQLVSLSVNPIRKHKIPATIIASPTKSNSRICCVRDIFGPDGGLRLRKKRRAAERAPVGLWIRKRHKVRLVETLREALGAQIDEEAPIPGSVCYLGDIRWGAYHLQDT